MLYFFVTPEHAYTFSTFLSEWSSARFKKLAHIVTYDNVPLIKDMMPGTFIFSDLDRLNRFQTKVLEDFCEQLAAADEDIPIINHPRTVLGRFDFLRRLHDKGINQFNVYPVSDLDCKPRYPVFLRMDNDHKGPLSHLQYNSRQRDTKILQVSMSGFDTNHMLQVEFCNTRSGDGFYRKYSAFRFGDQIIAAHMIFAKNWIAKDGTPPDELTKKESEKYLKENPHAEAIYEIFELAGITYGRIDYSMLDNTIQTWEINTNPILLKSRGKYTVEVTEIKEQLARRIEEGFLAMEYGGAEGLGPEVNRRIQFQWDARNFL